VEIENLQQIDSPPFQFERIRSVNYLKSALKQIAEHHASPEEKLENELKNAVEREDYERAAELRDRLKEMG
jgi:protein-arginine kinase activator protein McsA